MAKYQVLMKYPDGTESLEDDVFDTEEAAEEYGNYLVGCSSTGAETLNLSNPGDYPLEDFDEPEFEVVEAEE